MNWSEQTQRVEEWRRSSKGRLPHFQINEIRKNFDSSVEHADREIAALADQLLIFEPDNWEVENDWLLSSEQWAYLTMA
jgi:hypothetical protein